MTLNITRVEIGHVNCSIDELAAPNTDSEIRCTLANYIPAGTWLPQVSTVNGTIKVNETLVTPYQLNITLTTAYPTTGLNPAGGNIVTLVGEGFPNSFDGRY